MSLVYTHAKITCNILYPHKEYTCQNSLTTIDQIPSFNITEKVRPRREGSHKGPIVNEQTLSPVFYKFGLFHLYQVTSKTSVKRKLGVQALQNRTG